MTQILGSIDDNTRCEHYHSKLDIIAIKFFCCQNIFSCYLCHQELANHEAFVWPSDQLESKAVLCGNCETELTIKEYMRSNNICLSCLAQFNPGCKLHYHLYFATETDEEN